MFGRHAKGERVSTLLRALLSPPEEKTMSETIINTCDICGNDYQFGPHRYEGKTIPCYQLSVCMTCYEGNWDGWAPHLEGKVLEHLKSRGLPIPMRNDSGWLPRE